MRWLVGEGLPPERDRVQGLGFLCDRFAGIVFGHDPLELGLLVIRVLVARFLVARFLVVRILRFFLRILDLFGLTVPFSAVGTSDTFASCTGWRVPPTSAWPSQR